MRSSKRKYGDSGAPRGGVGGRQRDRTPTPEGGGYQDNCTNSELGNEEKSLRALELLNVHDLITDLAREIGVQNTLVVWQMLESWREVDGRFYLPSFSVISRAYRRRYVKRLREQGLSTKEIQMTLEKEGVSISETTIKRSEADENAEIGHLLEGIEYRPERERVAYRFSAGSVPEES